MKDVNKLRNMNTITGGGEDDFSGLQAVGSSQLPIGKHLNRFKEELINTGQSH